MPAVWFKHENHDILPFQVPYDEGQNVDAIVAAHSGNGWSRFEPDADEVRDLVDLIPASPAQEPPPEPTPSPGEPDDQKADRPGPSDPSSKE